MRSRTAIVRSTAFLGHDTGDHPERSARMIAIDCALEQGRLLADRPGVATSPASDAVVTRVHDQTMLENLEDVARAGGAWLDSDTVVRTDTVDVARMAAGGAVNAVDAILANRIDRAFVISRPPGHHATASRAMGFCLLNTAAIAAAHAIANSVERVAILDWDVHHGNGSQEMFYGRRDVLYGSLHQSPLYPGTGGASETGSGAGLGFTVNAPLPPGTDDARFLAAFRRVILPAIDSFAPRLLLISAGYDAHRDDPVGGLNVSDAGFDAIMAESIRLAERHCQGRILAVLEGGYHPQTLARCVASGIALLDGGRDLPNI